MSEGRRSLVCTYTQRDGSRSCDLPVVQVGATGLLIVNRHRGERHMNSVPFEWMLDAMMETEAGRTIFQNWLDKRNDEAVLTKSVVTVG